MADGATTTTPPSVRLRLARRDLAARGAPWVVVDDAHPDDVGDLRELIEGTGHPVLWRVGGDGLPEFAVTGPWVLTPPEAVGPWALEWLAAVPPEPLAVACYAAARRCAGAMTPAAHRSFAALGEWWSGGKENPVPLLRTLGGCIDRSRRPASLRSALAAYHAVDAALWPASPLAVTHRLSSILTELLWLRPAADTRAVILRALGARR